MMSIKQLVSYVSKFGLFHGFRVFIALKLGSNAVKVPGVKSPVYLRPGTTDATVFSKIFLYEEYNLKQLKGRQIRTIVDAGSNIGLAAVYFANRYPDAKIICIEPDAENFAQLKKNTSSYKNIKAIQAGLWKTNAQLAIANPNAAAWSFEVKESDGIATDGINGVTLDKIRLDHDINVLDIAKIDIEGSEKELFESNYESWLPSTRCLVIEVHDWKRKGASRSVFSALSQYHFSFSRKGENLIFTNDDLS